jgi:hypothetical protein
MDRGDLSVDLFWNLVDAALEGIDVALKLISLFWIEVERELYDPFSSNAT